jgi:hypothetical protein
MNSSLLLTMLAWQPYALNILFWCLRSSMWLGLSHISTFLILVKPASNHFADKRISTTCMMKIALHCYNGFAFSQWNDALCFLLHVCHCANCGNGSAYYSWKCMCMYMKNVQKRCVRTGFRKISSLISMLQPIPRLYLSYLESDKVSKLCKSIVSGQMSADQCKSPDDCITIHLQS